MRLQKFILSVIIILTTISTIKAYVWEWQFSIKNSNNQFISESISVYYYEPEGKKYVQLDSWNSLNYGNWGINNWNAIANFDGEEYDPDQEDATFTIPYYNEYVVVIGTSFVRIQYNGGVDETFTYTGSSIGTQNYTVVASGTWTVPYSITLKNDFAGGGMYINSEWHPNLYIS